MLCTECKKEIKPVVAIDIDGTLGMYHKHFLDFARAYLNSEWSGAKYDGGSSFKSWFCNAFAATEDQWHDIKLAYRQGGMKRTMPPYPYARELMQGLKKLDVELWVTTTRPYIRYDSVDPDTRHWLLRHEMPFDYLIYDGQKYEKLSQLVGPHRVAAVLDDLPEEIEHACREFDRFVPIHRQNNFNGSYRHNNAVSNLDMALERIKTQVQDWRNEYEGGGKEGRHAGHGHSGVRN